jgi:Spy/CpxP family protein refolding chaperone
MDIFIKNKFLIRLILVLIIINIASLVYIWWQQTEEKNAPPPKREKDAASVLKEKLSLSEEQEKQLKDIREDFFTKEKVLSQLIRQQRDSMNEEMFNDKFDSTQVKVIARRVAENEYQMELYRIEQAQQLKNICSKEQLDKFHDLVLDIRDYFQPEKNSKEKDRK